MFRVFIYEVHAYEFLAPASVKWYRLPVEKDLQLTISYAFWNLNVDKAPYPLSSADVK